MNKWGNAQFQTVVIEGLKPGKGKRDRQSPWRLQMTGPSVSTHFSGESPVSRDLDKNMKPSIQRNGRLMASARETNRENAYGNRETYFKAK